MPYKTFNNWLFDGSRGTPIPPPRGAVDILKYNSPITHTFALQLFMRHGPLNHYLDEYFNNIGLRYLTKDEFFLFLKQAVLDFRATKRDTVFYPYKAKNKLYDVLRQRIPQLKNDDISLLCEIIEKSDDKDTIYNTLGLEKPPKKQKLKIGKKEIKRDKKISLKGFLEEHFSIMKQ
jgi:hypothetical protein